MDVSATLEVPRRSTSSPEFEFWMVGNYPSTPQPDLLTADELFVDGVLLPLHLLSLPISDPQPETQTAPDPDPSPDPPPSASICCSAASPSASKRWRDIFKVSDKKPEDTKERRKDRKSSASGAAELNINIWPFSRSRSAGNGAARPRSAAATGRKVSSAPCSRSNSRGESSKPAACGGRKWAASPGRNNLSGGVHLGRASPVWRRPEKFAAKEKVSVSSRRASGSRISLNVNTCIGYRNQVTCRTDDGDGDGERAGGSGGLFSLRTLFTKKVY